MKSRADQQRTRSECLAARALEESEEVKLETTHEKPALH